MTDLSLDPIPRDVLALHWYRLLHKVLGSLQAAFRSSGYTQDVIAKRIGKDPATVNRCLRGQQANMTLRTMHDLARGMGFRLKIELEPLRDLPKANRRILPPALDVPAPAKKAAAAPAAPPKIYRSDKEISETGTRKREPQYA